MNNLFQNLKNKNNISIWFSDISISTKPLCTGNEIQIINFFKNHQAYKIKKIRELKYATEIIVSF